MLSLSKQLSWNFSLCKQNKMNIQLNLVLLNFDLWRWSLFDLNLSFYINLKEDKEQQIVSFIHESSSSSFSLSTARATRRHLSVILICKLGASKTWKFSTNFRFCFLREKLFFVWIYLKNEYFSAIYRNCEWRKNCLVLNRSYFYRLKNSSNPNLAANR